MQLFLIIKHQAGELQKRQGLCREHSMHSSRRQFKCQPKSASAPSAGLSAHCLLPCVSCVVRTERIVSGDSKKRLGEQQ